MNAKSRSTVAAVCATCTRCECAATAAPRTTTPERLSVLPAERQRSCPAARLLTMAAGAGLATVLGNGYGVMSVSGRRQYVHRVSYELHIGPIPEGLVIDHLCRNTRCFRPDHLEPVCQATNFRRGIHANAVAHSTDRCVRDLHDLVGGNVITSKTGRRRCRECYNEWHRQRSTRRAQAPASYSPQC